MQHISGDDCVINFLSVNYKSTVIGTVCRIVHVATLSAVHNY